MSRRSKSVPKYRLHKPSGQAVATVRMPDGRSRDIYLGRYGTEVSRAEYARVIAKIVEQQNEPRAAELIVGSGTATVAEVLLAYLKHAETYYLDQRTGEPTDHVGTVKLSIKPMRELFANLPADEFRPRHLLEVRDRMVSGGLSRKEVNRRVGVLKHMFKYAVSADLIHPDVFARLKAVEGLRSGRTSAPDLPRVRPAVVDHVEAAIPHMPPPVAVIVKLQRMTGARCGELTVLRLVDLDRSNPAVWLFRPYAHKGTWRGKERVIRFGKRSQEVLGPFLGQLDGPEAYVFSPILWEAERLAAKSAARKTPRYPSHMKRNETKRVGKRRLRPPGDCYDTPAVRKGIERACAKADVPIFTPHQLRHLAAHEIRAEFGIDVARAVLGHSLASMSEHYSKEVDAVLAMKAVEKFG